MKNRTIEALRARRALLDAHTHVGVSYLQYLEQAYPYSQSFEDLVIRMDALGIDRSVVFPTGSSYFHRAAFGAHPLLSAFPYERENANLFHEIFEIFPEHAERALPFAMFDPTHEADRQAAFLESLAARYPVFGLKTVTTYVRSFVTDLETKGRPILEFARRHGLPLLFHASYLKHDIWASVFDILAIAERHPDLRFCLAHSARFVRSVLDRAAAMPNCFVDLSAFQIHCDLAVRNSGAIPPEGQDRFPADYRAPEAALRALVQAYPDLLLWGTDSPYYYFIQKHVDAAGVLHDARLRCPFGRDMQILRALPPALIDTIAYRNTLRFLFG